MPAVSKSICDLSAIAANVVSRHGAYAIAKQQILAFEGGDEAALADVDSILTDRILDNLISNAVKFTPKGKAIRVTVETDPGEVRIRVIDEGPGIGADDRNMLFRKFTRLSASPIGGEPSLGLGLFAVKRLVDLIGVTVGLDDESRSGASLVVAVPRLQTAGTQAEA